MQCSNAQAVSEAFMQVRRNRAKLASDEAYSLALRDTALSIQGIIVFLERLIAPG